MPGLAAREAAWLASRQSRSRTTQAASSGPQQRAVYSEKPPCTWLRPLYAGSFTVPKLLGSLIDTLASSAIMRTYTSHLPTHVTFSALTALSLYTARPRPTMPCGRRWRSFVPHSIHRWLTATP